MKGWVVSDNNGEYGSDIVYADTAGKARALCMWDDVFGDCEWTDLRVHRFKDYDQYYDGNNKPDLWHEDEHRIRLVRDYGWSCLEKDWSYCEDCPARQYCLEEE